MRVADLIRDSVWLPNPARDDSTRPAVSVLLPTFARGSDGSFERAVRSVLDQRFTNIELIVIDDGSVDGTHATIGRVMAEDARVHCIRHPANLGLPAISMFEGYQRARADYLAFAFDDDRFTPEGLGKLVEFATSRGSACAHGYAEYGTFGPGPGERRTITLGRRDDRGRYGLLQDWFPEPGNEAQCLWRLHAHNFIGNMAWIVHRRVVETVGFYDPHVVVVRLCDWDLWRRIIARFRVDYCDVQVSVENGEVRSDALGQTVPIDFEQVVHYCRQPRDARLVPSRFPDFDVADLPASADARMKAYAALSLKWLHDLGRLRRVPAPPLLKSVVFVYDQGPSTHLLLHALPPDLQSGFYVHHWRTNAGILWPLVVHASALVICHRAEAFARLGMSPELAELGVPTYFYPADHPVPDNLAEVLPDLKGLLVPMAAAAQDSDAEVARWPVMHWPLSCDLASLDASALSQSHDGRTSVGVVGDDAGRRLALVGLAGISGLLVHGREDVDLPGGVDLAPVAEEMGWTQLVERWREREVEILLVAAGRSPETAFAGHAAILLACLCGAVPVVLDTAVVPELGADHGVVRLTDSPDALARVVNDLRPPSRRAHLYDRLQIHCRCAYSPDRAREAAQRFLETLPAVDAFTAQERWRRIERLRTQTLMAGERELEQQRSLTRAAEELVEDSRARLLVADQEMGLLRARCRDLERADRQRPDPPADPSTRALLRTLTRRTLRAIHGVPAVRRTVRVLEHLAPVRRWKQRVVGW